MKLKIVEVDTPAFGKRLMLASPDGEVLDGQVNVVIKQEIDDLVYVTATFQMKSVG